MRLIVGGSRGAALLAMSIALPAVAQTAVIAPPSGPLANAESAISREGEGTRRAGLNARERKAFDPATWATLSDWKNGNALTGTDTAGKVVLIVTWTDYLSSGKRAVQAATRVANKHKGECIVVLAHSQQDWENAAKPTSEGGLLVAHDAKGEFRRALDVDQDPDFYLIDRAGQLRYADIAAEAVDSAVAGLVAETKDDATSINTRLSDEVSRIDKDFRRTKAINQESSFVAIPELAFPAPSEQEYADTKWPPRPADEQKLDRDPKAELATKPVALPSTGWYPRKPEMKGRAVFIYLWNPHIPGSYTRIMPDADQLQRQYGRDVVVVGVMVNFDSSNTRKLTDEQRDPKKLMERFDSMCRSFNFEHYLVPSLDSNPYSIVNENSTEIPLPGIMILSSDTVCRWWQHDKAKINAFASLAEIIQKDPGILARRKVEADWLATHKDGK